MKLTKKHWVGIIAGLVIIGISSVFFWGQKLFFFLVVLSMIIIAMPFVIGVVLEGGRRKKIERRFLEFIRDLVENVKSGTPISKSIVNLRKRDYGVLSYNVEKMANQISMGIPLTIALRNFARDADNDVIDRSVNLISEAEKAGGDIETILESVASSVNQIDDLKKERKSAVYNLVVQGYVIFIVFIVIMLVLQYMIMPWTTDISKVEGTSLNVQPIVEAQFATPLLILLLVQSLFTGLVIGKIAEGSVRYGIKHSFILVALSLLISTGAGVFLG